jgi:hypothetical protein
MCVCWRSLQLEEAEVNAPKEAQCSTMQCMQGQPTATGASAQSRCDAAVLCAVSNASQAYTIVYCVSTRTS